MNRLKINKSFLFLFLIAVLTIIPFFIPSIETWCQEILGTHYKKIILAFFGIASTLILFFNSNFTERFFPNKKNNPLAQLQIKWSEENILHLQTAKRAIANANPEKALQQLSLVEEPVFNENVKILLQRFSQHKSDYIHDVKPIEEQDINLTRINDGILKLIGTVERNRIEGEEYVKKIRSYLEKRYQNRLNQKLAGRQPVNIKKLASTFGTSEETSAAFIPYSSDEIQMGIQNIYEDARGRLLIVGTPGSGKTTLLLQLELSLLAKKKNALPVILNLATWKNEFVNLETWLEEILPAELGTNENLAKKILAEIPLILLLDGFDEIQEAERNQCLEAIGQYSADGKTSFVITSRKKEYQAITKDAPVHAQIEVGALTVEQIESQLEQTGFDQPEAMPLLQAIRKDKLLRDAIKIPFYFNALQLLFANGKRLNDLNFQSTTVANRQIEIQEQFVKMTTQSIPKLGYDTEAIQRWLSFLAHEMNQHNLVTFELLDLQYTWGKFSKLELKLADLVSGFILIFLFVVVLAASIFLVLGPLDYIINGVLGMEGGTSFRFLRNMLKGGIIGGLIMIPILGLFRIGLEIETKDNINWSLKSFFAALYDAYLLPYLLLIMVLGGIGYYLNFQQLSYFMSFGIFAYFLASGFDMIQSNQNSILQINRPYQRFIASMRSLHLSILQHFLLRYLLYRKGKLPFQLVNFLNAMTKSNLLESDGATWRFRHRILQDYFAEHFKEKHKG